MLLSSRLLLSRRVRKYTNRYLGFIRGSFLLSYCTFAKKLATVTRSKILITPSPLTSAFGFADACSPNVNATVTRSRILTTPSRLTSAFGASNTTPAPRLRCSGMWVVYAIVFNGLPLRLSTLSWVNPANGERSDILLSVRDSSVSWVNPANGERSEMVLLSSDSSVSWVNPANGEISDIWLSVSHRNVSFVNPANGERSEMVLSSRSSHVSFVNPANGERSEMALKVSPRSVS